VPDLHGAHREETNMAISGITPITALPNAAQLSGSPLLGASPVGQDKPGIFSRIGSALKAAASALRGDVQPDAALGVQSLGMQAVASPAPVATSQPTVLTRVDKHGNVREKQSGTILKRANGEIPAGAEQLAVAAGLVPADALAQSQLASNATQVPGATVYSYDQNGNPVTMSQLGVTPTMLQGLTGMASGADRSATPQVNATNQNSIGLGGNGLLGTATPVLGQPILVADESAGAAATGSQPANQTVHNENATDIASQNQGIDYGYGLGGLGSGLATPYSPYGASMTGAYALGSTASRWF
jgi:hypothetical protein